MLRTGSSLQAHLPPSANRPWLLSSRGRLRMEPNSRRFVLGVALGVGLVSFLVTEILHYLLVPDLGRHQERLLAEGLSALIVSCLVAKLASVTREQHRRTIARIQVIGEMNHHIRNALTPISLSADATENQQLMHAISQGVDRIDWALREILPREMPLREEQRDKLGYFQTRERKRRRGYP
jgi:signal transduction histidine kinase